MRDVWGLKLEFLASQLGLPDFEGFTLSLPKGTLTYMQSLLLVANSYWLTKELRPVRA